MQETLILSLGLEDQEDPLEEEMTTHSSILAWEIPWIGEPGGLQSMGSAKSQTLLRDSTTTNTKNSHFNENNKSYELLSSLLGLQTTIFFFFFFYNLFRNTCYCLEEGMATHSSILAWRSPWTEEAGRL